MRLKARALWFEPQSRHGCSDALRGAAHVSASTNSIQKKLAHFLSTSSSIAPNNYQTASVMMLRSLHPHAPICARMRDNLHRPNLAMTSIHQGDGVKSMQVPRCAICQGLDMKIDIRFALDLEVFPNWKCIRLD